MDFELPENWKERAEGNVPDEWNTEWINRTVRYHAEIDEAMPALAEIREKILKEEKISKSDYLFWLEAHHVYPSKRTTLVALSLKAKKVISGLYGMPLN